MCLKLPCVIVTVLSRDKEVLKRAEVHGPGRGALGVLPLDGPDGGGRGEHAVHTVLLDDAEKLAGVRGADRLTLVDDGGVSVEKRGVADVLVTNYPSKVHNAFDVLYILSSDRCTRHHEYTYH